jgi:hypothetical protein
VQPGSMNQAFMHMQDERLGLFSGWIPPCHRRARWLLMPAITLVLQVFQHGAERVLCQRVRIRCQHGACRTTAIRHVRLHSSPWTILGSLPETVNHDLNRAAPGFAPGHSTGFHTVPVGACAQVISAPTGSGKTGVMELALLRLLSKQLDAGGTRLAGRRGAAKAVYIAPLRALCQEKLKDWTGR